MMDLNYGKERVTAGIRIQLPVLVASIIVLQLIIMHIYPRGGRLWNKYPEKDLSDRIFCNV